MITRQDIKKICEKVNLEFFGIIPTSKNAFRFGFYKNWLAENKHASMGFLEKYMDVRLNPQEIFPAAKTIILIGQSYNFGDSLSELKIRQENGQPSIAQYSRMPDYHKALKKKMNQFVQILELDYLQTKVQYRCSIDSAPILEKALFEKAAQGFIGKNTLWIHPQKGSLFCLGEIFLDLDLEVDAPNYVEPNIRKDVGGCGSCKKCQVNCPTGALDEAYTIDANKCLAYWSIEHRGPIPLIYWPHFKTYFFGCDICQLVCPYNRLNTFRHEGNEFVLPPLEEIAVMDQLYYENHFGGTPLTRAKKTGLQRNALISLFVLKHPKLIDVVATLQAQEELDDVLAQTIFNGKSLSAIL